jgi:UDP-2,3-diacylglucosamine hydrolase
MRDTPADRCAELRAPAHWQTVDLISDIHLQASEPATLDAWERCLDRPVAQRPDALFILGDLFEVWVGDDALQQPDTLAARCATRLYAHSLHTPTFFLHGNRDFLLRQDALTACGMQALHDPTVLDFQGTRYLLTHGDALCLDDTEYQAFRAMVRGPDWQTAFLARPLSERQATARGLREQSEARKRLSANDPDRWADVDHEAARAWLAHADALTLIHGHTHRPGEHDLGDGRRRVVLSDWDAAAHPPRAEVLRLGARGWRRLPL